MQQFTQKHTNTIAIAAVSGSILILLFGVIGAVAFRHIETPAPQATPSPAETNPVPSATPSPAPTDSPQAAAPSQAPTMPTAAPTTSAIAAVITLERTALKTEANAESQTLTLFHLGQVVTVLQERAIDGQWYQVSANGVVGYVPVEALSQPTKLSGVPREYVPQPQLAL